jgi:hypothetical protein
MKYEIGDKLYMVFQDRNDSTKIVTQYLAYILGIKDNTHYDIQFYSLNTTWKGIIKYKINTIDNDSDITVFKLNTKLYDLLKELKGLT